MERQSGKENNNGDRLLESQLELYDLLGLKECTSDLAELFKSLNEKVKCLTEDLQETNSVLKNWSGMEQIGNAIQHHSISPRENQEPGYSPIHLVPSYKAARERMP